MLIWRLWGKIWQDTLSIEDGIIMTCVYKSWINDKLNNGIKSEALLSGGTFTEECWGVYPGGSPWIHSLQTQSGFNGGVRWGSTNQPALSPLTPIRAQASREPARRSHIHNIIQFLRWRWCWGWRRAARFGEREWEKRAGHLRSAFDKIFKCLCPSGSQWCCEIVSPSEMDKGSL